MKFHLNSYNGCQLTDQREITPKLSEAELLFLCMTHCLIVLYNCMKFHLDSFNGCQLTEWTRNSIAMYSKGNNSKNIQSRGMVLEHDTSPNCALQLYEVSFL